MEKTKATKPVPSDEKLRELILYISIQSEGDEPYGRIKLNKLLFYADFLAYLDFNKPITGHEYQALTWGPAPRQLLPIMQDLQRRGEIAIRQIDFYGHEQHRPFALREPDLSVFSVSEIALISRLIKRCWGKTARQMTEESHQFVGWQLASDKESIPYSVALVGTREPTLDERRRGLELESLAMECLTRGV